MCACVGGKGETINLIGVALCYGDTRLTRNYHKFFYYEHIPYNTLFCCKILIGSF